MALTEEAKELKKQYNREYQRKWRAEHPEKIKEYRERNKENCKKWKQEHPERVKMHRENYWNKKAEELKQKTAAEN